MNDAPEPKRAAASEAIHSGAPTGDVLTDAQVRSWREAGFALVDAVLPRDLLLEARDDAIATFPAAGSADAESFTDFGSSGRMEFPAESEAVNALTLHPRLLRAVSQLLQTDTVNLRLTQSDLWPKYGRAGASGGERDNSDQRIHVDYPNHSLVHPPRWDRPDAVEMILYLSDREQCGGETALVPRQGPDDPAYAWPIVNTPGVGALEWRNDRASAEESLRREAPAVAAWRQEQLYPRELRADYRFGTLLLYRHDTWHRGTPLDPGSMRFAQNLTYRLAESEWISTLSRGWAWAMYRRSRVMEKLVASASVEQRNVLGFPPPGHPYWTADALDAIRARYGPLGMDVAPYQKGMP